jgi:hypothetical protein
LFINTDIINTDKRLLADLRCVPFLVNLTAAS